MGDSVFNLEFLWLPKEGELDDINNILNSRESDSNLKPTGSILRLKNNISDFCGFKIFIQDCKKRIEFPGDKEQDIQKKSKTEHSLFYLEFLFNVVCTTKSEKNPKDDLRHFISLFSSIRLGKLVPELYLKYDPTILDIKTTINTENTPKDIAQFSLGSMVGLNTFRERFSSKTSLEDSGYKITQNKLVLLHDYKRMILYFVVGKKCKVKKRNATTHRYYKLEIPYSSLHSVLISVNEGLAIYIRYLVPPLLFAVVQEEDEDCDYTSFQDICYKTRWFRTIDLFEGCPPHLKTEFTMNTVLKLDLNNKDYDFLFDLVTHCKNIQIYFAPVSIVKSPNPPVNVKFKLDDFECYYAMQCLLTHGNEINDQLIVREETNLVSKFLQTKIKENPLALSEAMYLVHEALVKGNPVIFSTCLKMLYERLQSKSVMAAVEDFSTKTPQPKHLMLIKRAILTPTHIILVPPQATLKSRALRDCNPDYSLRTSIKDNNMDTLNFSLRGSEMKHRYRDFFEKYYRNRLLKGIQIGNRCYKYVGSSTSQLKAHGLWFYAQDDKMRTSDDIRKDFGKMEKIRCVPKYMARMGQTFSQSMGYIKVPQSLTNVQNPEEDIEGGVKTYLDLTEDIERKRKFLQEVKEEDETSEEEAVKKVDPYTFSDGVGRISIDLAEEVYKALDVEESRPPAMQIRYAGCKGMLVVDPNLEGKKIMFRKSMRKFESDNDSLEILKFSEKRAAFLNRPFITILEQLGISKEVFLQLQKEMIQNHITAMFHNNAACDFLHLHSLLRFDFLSMHAADIHFTEDPLFRSMIYALFQKQIELLKKKANIEIPPNMGRTVFGVIDETSTLEYGQVFIQYSDWKTDVPIIVEGTVVVTKNPCMHPGDVRKFQAIDVKSLRHIVDCIVFPAKGPRPHPDEMAGSDLDGDEYQVMWLESLKFEKDNYPPMDFARREEDKPPEKDTDVQITDELDHVCEFIFNDKVGMIGYSHLVWADQHEKGIYSEVCLRLAKQYSVALDFAKSGMPVVRNYKYITPHYPDFMEKLDEKRTYLSTKALGILFRSCKRLELGLETEKNEIDYKVDNALIHKDWDKKYKKSALRVYKKYCDKMEFYLRSYGFENEGQLLAGALINPPKMYENRHDKDNLMTLLEYEIQFIFKDLERKFFEEFDGRPKDGVYTDDMLQKASAWYMVCYSKSEKVGARFFGMPWAVAKVLVALKTKNRDQNASRHKASKSILESIVDKSVSKHFPELTIETDSLEIYNNRLPVLDVAVKILSKWMKSQREYFSVPDIRKVEKCINKEFDTITSDIVTCDASYIEKLKKTGMIKKVISPCYLVIETLLHIAKIGATRPRFHLSDIRQELGLLAWMTLIKLACTYNPQYLGVSNQAGEYARTVFYKPQDNVIDVVQLPLFDPYDDSNMKFSNAVTHDIDEVKAYLIQQTKVKDIDLRHVQLRDSTYVRITVQGTRYSIERLKDIVVMKEFFEAVASRKPLSYYL